MYFFCFVVKPWLRSGAHVDRWKEYDHGLCSGNGKCMTEVEDVGGVCQCQNNFQGDLCEYEVDR